MISRAALRWSSQFATATGLVLTLTACGQFTDATSDAREKAAQDARNGARHAQETVAEVLRGPLRGERLQTRAQEAVKNLWSDAVVSGRLISDDRVAVDLAITGYGVSGGGLDKGQANVWLCVRLEGSAGPTPEVDLKDTPCPPGLPEQNGHGPIEGVVGVDE
ncbi:hypothetical protein [Actinokineospora globicatena]|uniref:Lipoprotein n=1 Tax=Actinokineospora globicatena TaxID=103729 RepID=A0A9W6V6J2_9PSEU|nr:hypothetical protein [Actinokineospora globicatena]GLW91640.1 hypothetical protein Aglo03_24560 [Actinokineospora globicatena]